MIVPLSRSYVARAGAPLLEQVDDRIFEFTYFHQCMDCSFCDDACCQFGADIEEPKTRTLLACADELESFLGVPRSDWFQADAWCDDPDYPGNRYTRTQVRPTAVGHRCVFLNRAGRGCQLHRFAADRGMPVQDFKPMACSLFPVLFDRKTLIVPSEIEDRTLVCLNSERTLYRGARRDLEHFFGPELINELDGMERTRFAKCADRPGSLPLLLSAG